MIILLILSPIRFHFTSHTLGPRIMSHTFSISHYLCLTSTFSAAFLRQFERILIYYLVTLATSWRPRDLISQYSADVNGIPPSQPDRSRTPPRHQHGWHQAVPAFRGPMHYAMTTHRPFWNPSGIPPPPPTSPSFPTRPPWTFTYGTFPAHAASELTDTSQPRQPCTSTSPFYTEITETYVIPRSKFLCQRRIYMQTN